jgi:hypothetical protein
VFSDNDSKGTVVHSRVQCWAYNIEQMTQQQLSTQAEDGT